MFHGAFAMELVLFMRLASQSYASLIILSVNLLLA
jgi:hypothetical protein